MLRGAESDDMSITAQNLALFARIMIERLERGAAFEARSWKPDCQS
jgi:hypothetical protein